MCARWGTARHPPLCSKNQPDHLAKRWHRSPILCITRRAVADDTFEWPKSVSSSLGGVAAREQKTAGLLCIQRNASSTATGGGGYMSLCHIAFLHSVYHTHGVVLYYNMRAIICNRTRLIPDDDDGLRYLRHSLLEIANPQIYSWDTHFYGTGHKTRITAAVCVDF